MPKLNVKVSFTGTDVVPALFMRSPPDQIRPVSPGAKISLEVGVRHRLVGFVLGPPAQIYEATLSVDSKTHEIKASRNPVSKHVPDSGKGWFTQPFSIEKKEN